MTDIARHERWTERAYSRVSCNVPTKSWYPQADQYIDVNIRNISKGGLYFESPLNLSPKAELDVFIGEDVFGPEMLEEARQYKASIRWVGEAQSDPKFRAGAQIINKRKAIEENHVRYLMRTCDLCGRIRFFSQFCEPEECIWLCQSCYAAYKDMPYGFKKYLLGNIY